MLVFSKIVIHTASKTRSVKGFTLLELIIAAAVSLTVLGVSLGMITEMRRSMLGDRTRITANDNLRQVSDFIGQDIKQAGERLESSSQLPGISIRQGAAGAPSTLVIQRQLLNETLPVCQSISADTEASDSTIDVSVLNGTIGTTDYGSAVSNCIYSYTAPSGGEPTTPATLSTLLPTNNLRSWRTYRCTQTASAASGTDPCTSSTNSAKAWAYIYDPVNKRGEFFQYSGETTGFSGTPTTRTCQKIQRVSSTPWLYSYTYSPTGPAASQPQLYLFEERKYDAIVDPSNANSYILQLTVNRQTPALRIANNLSNFQVWAKVPTSYTSAPSSAPTNWGCAASGSAATAPNPTSSTQWYCPNFNVDLTNTYTDPILSQQYLKDWQDLQGVRITLTGINPNDQLLNVDTASTNNALKLSSEFFPRNVLSRGS
jgi:hypothetical protein